MTAIRFKAKLSKIGSWTVLLLPKSASAKLPSRGMTMVDGSINSFPFQAALEPDGKGSHWFKVDEATRKGARADAGLPAQAGDTVTLAIEPVQEWPEPSVPSDLKTALLTDTKAYSLWKDITPMARWDWIRWISGPVQLGTRKRRIEATLDKLNKGERRPCCFNRNMCLVPDVSKNGVLPAPTQTA